MKKISAVSLAWVLMLMAFSPVYATVPGTTAGDYYYTDIITYLRDTPINSINIGGVTFIDAESMSHYGFTVKWHNDECWLEIVSESEEISAEAANGSLLDMKSGKPGTVAGKYYYTDIKATLDGAQIISYNIGGRTFIGAEAMRDFGYDVIWDGNARTLKIGRDYPSPAWVWEWSFIDGSQTAINNGFSFEFTNKTKSETVEFSLTDASGEYKAVGGLVFSDRSVTLTIYMNVQEYGDFWQVITANINVIYGDRKHEDSPERRAELSRVFRVYANGVELGGELSYTQGNGHKDYTFIYDKPLRLEDTGTLRLEVGYKQ